MSTSTAYAQRKGSLASITEALGNLTEQELCDFLAPGKIPPDKHPMLSAIRRDREDVVKLFLNPNNGLQHCVFLQWEPTAPEGAAYFGAQGISTQSEARGKVEIRNMILDTIRNLTPEWETAEEARQRGATSASPFPHTQRRR